LEDLVDATWNRFVRIFVSIASPLLNAVNQTDPATGEENLDKNKKIK
jgi:hypothetical protein